MVAYQSRLQHPRVDRLFEAILSLQNLEECYRFFEDLCTVGEIQSLALRFEVAQRLAQGQTYEQIQRETGMSSATISRVNRFLHYGADGYRLVLERLARRQVPSGDGASDEPARPAAGRRGAGDAGDAPPARPSPRRSPSTPPA